MSSSGRVISSRRSVVRGKGGGHQGEGGRPPGGREEGKGGRRGREGEVKGRWEGESESRMCCVGNQVSHGSAATL